MTELAQALKGRIEHVLLDQLIPDRFGATRHDYLAKLLVSSRDGQIEVDCRPSDAICIAHRCGVPIYVRDTLLRNP